MSSFSFRREHTGNASIDRLQRPVQEASAALRQMRGVPRLLDYQTAAISSTVATAAATWADLAGLSVTFLDARAGDLLFIDFAALLSSSGAGCQVRAVVVDGGNTIAVGNQGWATNVVAAVSAVSCVYEVANTGLVTVKMQGQCTGAATLSVLCGATGGTPAIRVQRYREMG
jgi:hypothetical protein